MDLLAGSAERISVVSVKRAALSAVIIRPNGLSARSVSQPCEQMVCSYFRQSVLLASNPVEECARTFLYFPSSTSRSEVLLWGRILGR